jgi:CheY-like chemotaxis protein
VAEIKGSEKFRLGRMVALVRDGGGFLKTILLVDDSKFQRLANERALAKAGFQVLTAGDGEQALEIAASTIPDLIVLDMLLPKLTGPEVLKALRKNRQTSAIPIVVLSSLAQINEAKLVREGATAYFEKSKLDLTDSSEPLLKVVQQILGQSDVAGDDPSPESLVTLSDSQLAVHQ